MGDFIKAAETTDIPEGKMKPITINSKEILLTNIKGNYHAIGNKCTHRGGQLSKGTLEGDIVTCPLHGSKFNVKTGEVISGPKILFLHLSIKPEPTYEVKVEGKDIMVKDG